MMSIGVRDPLVANVCQHYGGRNLLVSVLNHYLGDRCHFVQSKKGGKLCENLKKKELKMRNLT